jgi:TolB protein
MACAAMVWLAAVAAHAQTAALPASAPVRIAIPAFSSDSPEAEDWAKRIAAVVSADLARSNALVPLEATALAQERISLNAMPLFAEWRTTSASALLVGSVATVSGERLRLAFRLWNVSTGEQLIGEQFYAPRQHWRRLAHVAADSVYSRMTGAPGYFDTRIAFVERRPDEEGGRTQLAIMDQDGTNLEYIADSGNGTFLSPEFSPVAQQLIYVTELGGVPRVILRDLQHGASEVVGDFPGLVSAPRFAPDGHRVVMSIRRGGNANLHALDLRTRVLTRLTETAALDTDAAYSPSGRQIVFVSQRSGTPQLYVMRANGSRQQRISRGEGSYDEPVWSPRGNLIAFTKRMRGGMLLGLMAPDGTNERIVASGADISGLSWAPNGRVLVFSRSLPADAGGPRLFTIGVSGEPERLLETPGAAFDPSWSATLGQRNTQRKR